MKGYFSKCTCFLRHWLKNNAALPMSVKTKITVRFTEYSSYKIIFLKIIYTTATLKQLWATILHLNIPN